MVTTLISSMYCSEFLLCSFILSLFASVFFTWRRGGRVGEGEEIVDPGNICKFNEKSRRLSSRLLLSISFGIVKNIRLSPLSLS